MKARTTRRAAITLAVLGGGVGLLSAATGAVGAGIAHERITLTGTSTGTTNSPIRVVARGPIKGVGTAEIKSGPDHSEPTTLRFAQGTVYAIAVQKSQSIHINSEQCTATNDSRGTFTITGGTRALRGVRGHLTYHTRAVLVGTRSPSGACLGTSAPPISTSIKSTATGTATSA